MLLSTKDGTVVRNLTPGFDQGYGFAYIVDSGRPLEHRVVDVVVAEGRRHRLLRAHREGADADPAERGDRQVKNRIPMKSVDDPESPAIAPDGRHVAFSALRDAIGDIFMLDLDTGEIENLTNDAFADYGPTFSPDG